MTVRQEDWDVLGLEADADLAAVKKAYRHRRSLYEPSALATYSLLDDEERTEVANRIEEAYRRIMEYLVPEEAVAAPPPPPPEKVDMPTGPAPDPVEDPGRHLRHQRLTRGLSIDRIATATKISASILKQIENEDFDALPAAVFVRGHIVQLGREIGITDIEGLAKLYMAKMANSVDDEA